MRTSLINPQTSFLIKSKILKPIFFILFIFFLNITYANNQKVEVSCSEIDADIYGNGELKGKGKVIVIVVKNEPMIIKIKKDGFLTDEFSIPYGNGVSPEKKYFRTLIKDESREDMNNASALTDVANVDIDIQTSKIEDKAWKLLSEVITNYFDIIEVTDKSTGYIRTSWAVQSFKNTTVRTRVVIKTSSSDNLLKYKVKIISEISEKPNTSAKDDEKYKSWDRILKKYNDLIPELQSRLK